MNIIDKERAKEFNNNQLDIIMDEHNNNDFMHQARHICAQAIQNGVKIDPEFVIQTKKRLSIMTA